ncbi:MAG: peptidoglycan editing factor PgeF, partial [Parvibaculaceae bacterium]
MADGSGLAGIGGIRHAFFTREGGHSSGLYASLNCGFGSDDDKTLVRRNREQVAERMQVVPEKLLTVWQWHSADAHHVEAPWNPLHPPKADAMVTDRPGFALGILTADCTPVLFAAVDGRVIGAAHAGWKGAISGVLETTLEAMERLGARRGDIHATIGPTISQASYEVSHDFREKFVAADPANATFFIPSRREMHFMFDLPGYVRARLEGAGVASISDVATCTYA